MNWRNSLLQLGPIFMGVSHTWRLPFMYWNQQTADYYAGHCSSCCSLCISYSPLSFHAFFLICKNEFEQNVIWYLKVCSRFQIQVGYSSQSTSLKSTKSKMGPKFSSRKLILYISKTQTAASRKFYSNKALFWYLRLRQTCNHTFF